MRVSELNVKLGTEADEDLIGSTTRRDQLYGFGGKDRLYGQGGDDQLYGGNGNDLLDGGTGTDIMYGGTGDDLYRVDNLADVVSETTIAGVDDGGVDTVESTITYALGSFVEKLTLKGTAAINATGNNLANRLAGNDAANVLSGAGGDDLMYGNGGDDPDRWDGKGRTLGRRGFGHFRIPHARRCERRPGQGLRGRRPYRDLRRRLRIELGATGWSITEPAIWFWIPLTSRPWPARRASSRVRRRVTGSLYSRPLPRRTR